MVLDIRRFLRRCWATLAPGGGDRELSRELASHLLHLEEHFRASGYSPREARLAARRTLGGLEQSRELQRDERTFRGFSDLGRDLRHAVRLVSRHRLSTVVTIVTLACTIAANATVFAFVDRVLLSPLSIQRPDRVVVIWPRERTNPTAAGEVSYAAFQRWQQELEGLDDLSAIGSTNWSLVLREGEPATLPVAAVSGGFFQLLGTRAAVGRTLNSDDDRPGAGRVAVLSYATWQRRFGGDLGIVNRAVRFEKAMYTIVGIAPPGFDYPAGAEAWIALTPQLVDASTGSGVNAMTDPGLSLLFVLGRLRDGMDVTVVRERATALMTGMTEYFRPNSEAVLTPLDEYIYGQMRPALLAALACGVFALLAAIGNVTTLMLAWASSRIHEFATRLALGESRWRLIRACLLEAAIPTIAGGFLGILLAVWCVELLSGLVPMKETRLLGVQLDYRSVLVGAALSVTATLAIGFLFAASVARCKLSQTLATGNSRLIGASPLRRLLVVGQTALAALLIAAAAFVGQSFRRLLAIDVGFNPRHVLTLDLTLPGAGTARRQALVDGILERLRGLNEVEAAGAVFLRPLEYSGIGQDAPILLEGDSVDRQQRASDRHPLANLETVTPDYFRAVGLPIVQGRAFSQSDSPTAPRVAILSERLAGQLWPGESAIGKRLLPRGVDDVQGTPRWATVVGVAADARYRGLTDPRGDLYLPDVQVLGLPVKHLMVRTSGNPLDLVPTIRAEANRLDSAAIVERVDLMETLVDRATAPWRFSTWVLSAFAGLALAVSALGTYVSASQSAAARRKEIGVRISLGARSGDIVMLIVKSDLALSLFGLGLGLGASVMLGRAMSRFLHSAPSFDARTLAASGLALVAVSAIALIVPAWHATRVDSVRLLHRT